MESQLEIDWTRSHARRTDPDTSKAAAESVQTAASRHEAAILAELAVSSVPLAAEQLADRLGLDHVQVNRRLPDLEHAGVARKTDERHQNRSGRWAVKWEAI